MSRKRMTATRILLMLYCVLLGILCGAGLFQRIVLVPGWQSGADILRTYEHGFGFFPFVTPPLTLIAITLAFVGWRSPQPMKRWLYTSLVPFIILDAFTFGWYLPVLFSMEYDPMSAAEFAATKERWAQVDLIRQLGAPVLVAAAIHAYALSYRAAAAARAEGISPERAPAT